MKKSIPPLEKHSSHQVEIRPGTLKHAAKYWCLDCDKWVAWVSLKEAIEAEKLGLINFGELHD